MAPRSPGAGYRRGAALGADGASVDRSGSGPVLLAADRGAVVHPRVRAGGAGGQAVRPAGLHQDLHAGGGGRPGHHAGTGADGLPDPGPHSQRSGQPRQPLAGARLPPATRRQPGPPAHHHRRRAGGAGADGHPPVAPGRRIPAAAERRRPALHALRPARPVGGQGRRTAAADGPPDQDGAGSGHRVRQGRAGRIGHRSGTDGNVRNDHPVQAARPVAARHDAGQAGGGTGPGGPGARPGQRVGAAHPQPHRHALDRHQDPGGRQGVRAGPAADRPHRHRHRGGRQAGARRNVGAGRTPARRALHRRDGGPAPRRPLRPGRGGRAVRGGRGHRRRERGRSGGRTPALPRQRALSAGLPQLAAGAAPAARHHAQGRPDPAGRRGRHRRQRRAAHDTQRERPPVGLGLRRRARRGPGRRRARHARARGAGRGPASGLRHRLVRPV